MREFKKRLHGLWPTAIFIEMRSLYDGGIRESVHRPHQSSPDLGAVSVASCRGGRSCRLSITASRRFGPGYTCLDDETRDQLAVSERHGTSNHARVVLVSVATPPVLSDTVSSQGHPDLIY